MSVTALALVLVAAVLHATWNLNAKPTAGGLRFVCVTHIAPAREVSILIGAFIGARLFKEADGRRRVWATVAMAAGVIALALG